MIPTKKPDTRKWVKPVRLSELDDAEFIKTENGVFSPFQFRTLYHESAPQFHKLFLQMQKEDTIHITHKV